MTVRTLSTDTQNVSTRARIFDATTGLPATGITHATAGLGLYYQRDGAAQVSFAPASLAAANSAHTDGGFFELGDGWYRVDLPDAAIAGSVPSVAVGVTLAGHVAFAPTMLIEPPASVSLGSWAIGQVLIGGDVGVLINQHDSSIDTQLAALAASLAALNDLSAADVRAALGLAAANLDTQLAGNLGEHATTQAAIGALNDLDASAVAAAVAGMSVEGALTLLPVLRLLMAAQFGKVAGAATATITFRDLADTKNRIAATVDADGNRTALTLDGS